MHSWYPRGYWPGQGSFATSLQDLRFSDPNALENTVLLSIYTSPEETMYQTTLYID